MQVLCFDPAAAGNPYIHNLTHSSTRTAYAADYRSFLLEVKARPFDIILIGCNDRSWTEVLRTRYMATIARRMYPACLIVIQRFSSGPLPPWFRRIPPSLYDFRFDDYLSPSFLPLVAATLARRRKHLLRLHPGVSGLKGMIAMDQLLGRMLQSTLTQNHLITIPTEVDDNFEAKFRHQFPDFVVLHCHNRDGDFDIVKQATHTIRRLHPGCIIYVTCSDEALEYYASKYRFHEYFYDELLTLPVTGKQLLTKLINHLSLRYHVATPHP
ncbi:hypothetical protein HHL17_21740 [Chitinophaga sp. G-6-1-13]|uniref:Uncharacterized protein n=1 Tax=Chitinophaga fulva TaxID=2728842 RepID=A0A848GPD4_9BACT|nr:hypothetical protein [Chitinophaga fulva]NML39837.1 hypothetical protein [Chitinophaga fulva]